MKIILRGFLLICFFISLGKAWAGVRFYEGMQAYQQKHYEKALSFFNQSEILDSLNPELKDYAGRSAYYAGLEDRDEGMIRLAADKFAALLRQLPFYGRGWVFLGLSHAALKQMDPTNTEIQDSEILRYFEKGLSREPGSAWAAYLTGEQLLRKTPLTHDEESKGLDYLKKAASIKFDARPPFYLKNIAEFLWQKYQTTAVLKKVTPPDAASYRILVEMMAEKGLWPYFDHVYADYLNFNREAYQAKVGQAIRLLERSKNNLAFELFREAYWMDKYRKDAKTGMLISAHRLGIPLHNADEFLAEILGDETPIIGWQEQLAPVVRKTADPYLEGVFLFKTGNAAGTLARLENLNSQESSGKPIRRIVALCYEALGEKEKALAQLTPGLEEKGTDLRDLSLLKRLNPSDQVQAKIEQEALSLWPSSGWWEGRRLNGKGSLKIALNLKPGKVRLTLKAKSFPSAAGEYASVVIRLAQEILGAAYVDNPEEKEISFDVETSGGWQKLEVKMQNETSDSLPALEMGDVTVGYLPQAEDVLKV